jgi:hypothetical protein
MILQTGFFTEDGQQTRILLGRILLMVRKFVSLHLHKIKAVNIEINFFRCTFSIRHFSIARTQTPCKRVKTANKTTREENVHSNNI